MILKGDLQCPRCKRRCRRLVPPYWDSPHKDAGGICPTCCERAAAHYDKVGWPERQPIVASGAPVIWPEEWADLELIFE